MAQPFSTELDIANRALQHVGTTRITSLTQDSKAASEINDCYDKLRVAELRRNVWRFAVRNVVLRPIDTTTLVLVPPAWDQNAKYFTGAIVSYNGLYWLAGEAIAVGAVPDAALENGWEQYFGPLTISPYDTTGTTAYYAGELVYTYQVGFGVSIFVSTHNANSDVPNTYPEYSATVQYNYGQSVFSTPYNAAFTSISDVNLGNDPRNGKAWMLELDNWDASVNYSTGDYVYGSDGKTYVAIQGSTNQNPTIHNGYWAVTLWSMPAVPTGQKWVWLKTAQYQSITPVYPLGSGPSSQSATANIFMLPNGYLRQAPSDPKAGSQSYLGAPSNGLYDDWVFQGDFIVSSETGPIVLRFVADVADVTEMDPMFCEGLGARIATEICEALTQSAEKIATIAKAYTGFMTEARVINGIETGATEPPLDDFIACRA